MPDQATCPLCGQPVDREEHPDTSSNPRWGLTLGADHQHARVHRGCFVRWRRGGIALICVDGPLAGYSFVITPEENARVALTADELLGQLLPEAPEGYYWPSGPNDARVLQWVGAVDGGAGE